jgi:hypothetical protein
MPSNAQGSITRPERIVRPVTNQDASSNRKLSLNTPLVEAPLTSRELGEMNPRLAFARNRAHNEQM